jgi:hypothetical protein
MVLKQGDWLCKPFGTAKLYPENNYSLFLNPEEI